jgi:hypothetical protein
MSSAELIHAISKALFGGSGESAALARVLDVNERSIRRWKSGAEEPPAGVWTELHAIAAQRLADLRALIREIDERRRQDGS